MSEVDNVVRQIEEAISRGLLARDQLLVKRLVHQLIDIAHEDGRMQGIEEADL